MSPASLHRMDSNTQALDQNIPFDYTTHPDWPKNDPMQYNLKVLQEEPSHHNFKMTIIEPNPVERAQCQHKIQQHNSEKLNIHLLHQR